MQLCAQLSVRSIASVLGYADTIQEESQSLMWALIMLRKMDLMGESVHDGPGTYSANAALCAAWQRR